MYCSTVLKLFPFIWIFLFGYISGEIKGAKEEMLKGKKQQYTLDLDWLKELWHRAAVMALMKGKAKSILKTDPYITSHERLVYLQCEKEAQTPVALAKCTVTLMNVRDAATAPVENKNSPYSDNPTFWDMFVPWKKLTNFREIAQITQNIHTTTTTQEPNYTKKTYFKPAYIHIRPSKKKSGLKIYRKKPISKKIVHYSNMPHQNLTYGPYSNTTYPLNMTYNNHYYSSMYPQNSTSRQYLYSNPYANIYPNNFYTNPYYQEYVKNNFYFQGSKIYPKEEYSDSNYSHNYITYYRRSENPNSYPKNTYPTEIYPKNVYSAQTISNSDYPVHTYPKYSDPKQFSTTTYKHMYKTKPRRYSSDAKKYKLSPAQKEDFNRHANQLFVNYTSQTRTSQKTYRQKRGIVEELANINTRQNNMQKLSNLDKLRILQEYTQMQKHAQNFMKKVNSENSKFLKSQGFPFQYDTEKPKQLSFVEDVMEIVNGYLRKANFTEISGLDILSPRVMPFFAKNSHSQKTGILSPTLLSFQKDGILSWPAILQFLTGSDKVDRDGWMDFILDISGGKKALDKSLKLLEGDIKEMKYKIYPTVLEMEQMEKDWGLMSKMHSKRQKRELDKYGYAFLEPKQIELAYRNRFTQKHNIDLHEYAKMSSSEREKILEDDIRAIAKFDTNIDQNGNYKENHRFKRQFPPTDTTPRINVLSPSAFSNRINVGLINKANILSPTAFVTEINNLVSFVHLTLSPTAFSASILNPAILFSRVLSPVVFRVEIMHPRILHAWVLSPTAFAARVLSPRILQARIGSPLSMIVNVLSPGIIHPRVLSPDGPAIAVLSPQILAPRMGSPNFMVVNILSPPIMSDPIDEPLNKTMGMPAPLLPWQPWDPFRWRPCNEGINLADQNTIWSISLIVCISNTFTMLQCE